MSLIAAAIWASWMTILRRWASCTRSRSSINWRRICDFSRSITSGDKGRPVEMANSRARLPISASLITSPLTTAAMRLASASGWSAGGGLGPTGSRAARTVSPASQRQNRSRPASATPPKTRQGRKSDMLETAKNETSRRRGRHFRHSQTHIAR